MAVEAPVVDTFLTPLDPMAGDTTMAVEGATQSAKRAVSNVDTTAWPGAPSAKKAKSDEESPSTVEVDANAEDGSASPATVTADPDAPPDGTSPPAGQDVEVSTEEEVNDEAGRDKVDKEEADKEGACKETNKEKMPPASDANDAMDVTAPDATETAKAPDKSLTEAVAFNVNGALASAFSGKSLRCLLGAPVTALRGLEGESMAASADSVWADIGALATWKPLIAARALSGMAQLMADGEEECGVVVPAHMVRFGKCDLVGGTRWASGRLEIRLGADQPLLLSLFFVTWSILTVHVLCNSCFWFFTCLLPHWPYVWNHVGGGRLQDVHAVGSSCCARVCSRRCVDDDRLLPVVRRGIQLDGAGGVAPGQRGSCHCGRGGV